jgi:hypothetical protein
LNRLTDEQKPEAAKKLSAACAVDDHAGAKLALNMLTVHRLHVPT